MRKLFAVLACLLGMTGCYYDAGPVSVLSDVVEVGRTQVGDSVHATFKFKNNTGSPVKVSFMPECDCTTVDIDSLALKPGERGRLNVSVAIEVPGEFYKYVYVQEVGGDVFLTVSIHGRAE